MSVKRLNYFDHQFLRADDFNDEQQYHVEMRRRHNRTLHTPGVAEGFKVTFEPEATAVTVQPGTAYDGQGREIVLTESVKKELSGQQAGEAVYLTVAYEERQSDATNETGVQGNTRWTESALVGVSTSAPTDPDLQLLLAKVTRDGTKVTAVDETGRRAAGTKGAATSDLVAGTLTLKRAGDKTAERPALSCGAANQAALTNGSLKLDAGREIFFQDTGQIRSFDGSHKLVFNRPSERLEVHEQGDIVFHTGGQTPPERMRISREGKLGLGTATPKAPLQVNAMAAVSEWAGWVSIGSNSFFEENAWKRIDTNKGGVNIHMNPDADGQEFRFMRDDPGAPRGVAAIGTGVTHFTSNVGIGTGAPQDKLEVAGNLRILTDKNPIRFVSDWTGFALVGQPVNRAEIANDTASYQALMIVGNRSSGERRVQVWDWLDVRGRLTVNGGKAGYVMDQFVNNLGETLEQGDVVVVGSNQTTLYYGQDNNIPIPEIDLTEQAYDTRLCGIVCEVFGKVVKVDVGETEGGTRSAKGKRGKEAEPPATLQARRLTGEELEGRDQTKVEPGQTGFMVTLGAFTHCKVDADIAPVEIGDLLTTSTTRGHAQKVTDRAMATGAILGKALGSLKKGKGKIPVLVTLH